MLQRSCTAEAAFAALVEFSQNTNVKLHDVAEVVVVAGSRTDRTAGHAARRRPAGGVRRGCAGTRSAELLPACGTTASRPAWRLCDRGRRAPQPRTRCGGAPHVREQG
ncbi:ANTAR domain-containing protein [Amycolatopsis sp. cmx-4-68]|uniref:ANTAR domain-containing protein n=1 Tax=Amycolatopsis sp. cmx-4-68 TaxID=2790938 RepID=UPI003977FC72